ncbi:ArsR family transcriptional regulator, partial [Streptomyces beijiangensis]|nr:ArsR family transcriptional regulator [Streptomyces beijiangensis]
AARALSREMFLRGESAANRWVDDTAPLLDPDWLRLSGLANTGIVVSADELAAIEEEMERIVAPYVLRDPSARPAGVRGVRLLRYFLPEHIEEQSSGTAS